MWPGTVINKPYRKSIAIEKYKNDAEMWIEWEIRCKTNKNSKLRPRYDCLSRSLLLSLLPSLLAVIWFLTSLRCIWMRFDAIYCLLLVIIIVDFFFFLLFFLLLDFDAYSSSNSIVLATCFLVLYCQSLFFFIPFALLCFLPKIKTKQEKIKEAEKQRIVPC